ncbi:MAG: ribonuclease domain-containing protein [Candidatus Pelethousia sp.]|nr:ribonuclease domain-containing protein [Candidatus Pelethousia sp.]
MIKRWFSLVLCLFLLLALCACARFMQSPAFTMQPIMPHLTEGILENTPLLPKSSPAQTPVLSPAPASLSEDGTYDSQADVSLYLHAYGHLPANYLTKNEARSLGWDGGDLEPYAPGKCIGGDNFGNYEGLLPDARGRVYTECDINTLGKSSRGAERIVFSNDGLIYYTANHYDSFTLLYGEE